MSYYLELSSENATYSSNFFEESNWQILYLIYSFIVDCPAISIHLPRGLEIHVAWVRLGKKVYLCSNLALDHFFHIWKTRLNQRVCFGTAIFVENKYHFTKESPFDFFEVFSREITNPKGLFRNVWTLHFFQLFLVFQIAFSEYRSSHFHFATFEKKIISMTFLRRWVPMLIN